MWRETKRTGQDHPHKSTTARRTTASAATRRLLQSTCCTSTAWKTTATRLSSSSSKMQRRHLPWARRPPEEERGTRPTEAATSRAPTARARRRRSLSRSGASMRPHSGGRSCDARALPPRARPTMRGRTGQTTATRRCAWRTCTRLGARQPSAMPCCPPRGSRRSGATTAPPQCTLAWQSCAKILDGARTREMQAASTPKPTFRTSATPRSCHTPAAAPMTASTGATRNASSKEVTRSKCGLTSSCSTGCAACATRATAQSRWAIGGIAPRPSSCFLHSPMHLGRRTGRPTRPSHSSTHAHFTTRAGARGTTYTRHLQGACMLFQRRAAHAQD
mmetsp:Transcript_8121/g.32922  ORF Transcript_8121/g.32922 Transcript_8121/m.32922 type:complete len:333 (-) Transcript_8121:436-1434(-)